MIKKLIRQMLAAQILSALTVSLCLLIDSVMISRFLGKRAIAAYGFANPLLPAPMAEARGVRSRITTIIKATEAMPATARAEE